MDNELRNTADLIKKLKAANVFHKIVEFLVALKSLSYEEGDAQTLLDLTTRIKEFADRNSPALASSARINLEGLKYVTNTGFSVADRRKAFEESRNNLIYDIENTSLRSHHIPKSICTFIIRDEEHNRSLA